MKHKTLPQHIAIIMDGNGRWARKRHLPRLAGHARGVKRVREMVEACVARKIPYLTLFAFSTENWKRPPDEVRGLLRLFAEALEREVEMMHKNGVRLRIVGDLSAFDTALQDLIHASEAKTAGNTALTMTIAVNYGGRWDITQAMLRWFVNQFAPTAPRSRQDWLDMLAGIEQQQRDMPALEEALKGYISTAYAPDPDLLIRTGGECRISNFMLWQLAYTEIYFTEAFWPEFSEQRLDEAIEWFAQRERRFGKTSEQIKK